MRSWARSQARAHSELDATSFALAVAARVRGALKTDSAGEATGGTEHEIDISEPPGGWTNPWLVGAAHEQAANSADRTKRGAWYTPRTVVEGLVAMALVGSNETPSFTVDPTCGGGAFLLATLDHLVAHGVSPEMAVESVGGVDIDPGAIEVAKTAIALWALMHGCRDVEPKVERADFLTSYPKRWPAPSAIVGNPPFASPLKSRAVGGSAAAFRDQRPTLFGPYADTAACHLVRAIEIVSPGGVVCLVQPVSVLSGRDTEGMRDHFDGVASLDAMWCTRESVFDAGVRVVALSICRFPATEAARLAAAAETRLLSARGADAARLAAAAETRLLSAQGAEAARLAAAAETRLLSAQGAEAERLAAAAETPLLSAQGAEAARLAAAAETRLLSARGAEAARLGPAGAGEAAGERPQSHVRLASGVPPKVTKTVTLKTRGKGSESGLASPWSSLAAQAFGVPSVELDLSRRLGEISQATAGFRDEHYGLAEACVEDSESSSELRLTTVGSIDPLFGWWGHRQTRFAGNLWDRPVIEPDRLNPKVGRWVQNQLRPKVVLPTQSRVLEPLIDLAGNLVPATPVLAIHTSADHLHHVAAVLLAPPIVAWALERSFGSAMSLDAVKLSASQVKNLPLPNDVAAWDRAADVLASSNVSSAAEGREVALSVARLMMDAYNAEPEVMEWYESRFPTAK